jgi:hypothetical protein
MNPRILPHFRRLHNRRPIEHQAFGAKDAQVVFANQARNEKANQPRANKARKAAPENKSTDTA